MYQEYNNSLPEQFTALLGTHNSEKIEWMSSSKFDIIVNSEEIVSDVAVLSCGIPSQNSSEMLHPFSFIKGKLKLSSSALNQIQFDKEAC